MSISPLLRSTLCRRACSGGLTPLCQTATRHFASAISAPIATFHLPNASGEEIPALLHPMTPVVRGPERIKAEEVERYADLKNHIWKSPTVQAFLHSFSSGDAVGLVELDRSVFGATIRPDILARALRYEESWREQGTESTKNLGQVRGSTRKPFQQKGRGKARVGTVRAPQWKGGYRVHGPVPHDKSTDIPRNVYNLAIRSALSTKFAQDQLHVVDSLTMDTDMRHALIERLRALSLAGKKVYLMYGSEEPEVLLIRAADKFKKKRASEESEAMKPLLVTSARHVTVSPLLENEHLVLDKAAVEVLEEMYHAE